MCPLVDVAVGGLFASAAKTEKYTTTEYTNLAIGVILNLTSIGIYSDIRSRCSTSGVTSRRLRSG